MFVIDFTCVSSLFSSSKFDLNSQTIGNIVVPDVVNKMDGRSELYHLIRQSYVCLNRCWVWRLNEEILSHEDLMLVFLLLLLQMLDPNNFLYDIGCILSGAC